LTVVAAAQVSKQDPMNTGVVARRVWAAIQDEATKEESKSGLPMFGNEFSRRV